jgi:hypothetical protein
MKLFRQAMALLLSWCLVIVGVPGGFADKTQPPAQALQQDPAQLQRVVAPIALYPDGLVAQILAAASYPDQVVEAGKWMEQHKNLTGQKLAKEVDKQHWDTSVKALTQFPAVLANMSQNLAWTSELGDAYVNQKQAVTQAIQTMRQTTPQEKVTTQGQTIVIQPAAPNVVYVPQYDPWLAYGYPLAAFPGWYPVPGLFLGGPGIGFGLGFGVGLFAGFGWGWGNWGYNWRGGGGVVFNHNTYISHSTSIVNRNNFHPGGAGFGQPGGFHGGNNFHPGGAEPGQSGGLSGGNNFHPGGAEPGQSGGLNGGNNSHPGGAEPGQSGGLNGGNNFHPGGAEPGQSGGLNGGNNFHTGGAEPGQSGGGAGMHSSAFGGFNHGGFARAHASRGMSSFGGFHGGGFHRGGGRR